MSDYSEVYSLLFTGIVIIFLFLTILNLIDSFESKYDLRLTSGVLTSKTVKYSRVLTEAELEQYYFVNLETNKDYGTLNEGITSNLPFLLLKDNSFFVGRVSVSE